MALWGNRCDLSLSVGRAVETTGDPFLLLDSIESCILVDRSKETWNCIETAGPTAQIDIVLDNAGYELFTDFLFIDFLLHFNLVSKIRVHCKAIPWFVSDVVQRDFHWTIKTLANHSDENVNKFGNRLEKYVNDRRLVLCETEWFWTSPYEFQAMETIDGELYRRLSESSLVIFKGDLNYRKLLADVHWPFDSTFIDVLGTFRPTNICTLRTVKADCICEITYEKANELAELDKMWMETGKYGLIQFAAKP